MIKFANSTVRLNQAEKEEVCALYANGVKWLHILKEENEVIAIAYNKERQEMAKVYGNLPPMLLKAHDCEDGTLVLSMASLMENVIKEE